MKKRQVLIVDGYNIIHDWRDLYGISERIGLSAARDALIHILSDYAGYSEANIVLVFDAYQTDRQQLTDTTVSGIRVVYTRKGETADHFIERYVDELDDDFFNIRVATSDSVEQTVVMGRGAVRMSARELKTEIDEALNARNQVIETLRPVKPHTLGSTLDPEVLRKIQEMIDSEEDG